MNVSIDHVAVLRRECERVSELVRAVDHAAPVPHLSGWEVHDVVAHLVGDFIWVLETLSTRALPRTGIVPAESRGAALCSDWDAAVTRLIDRLEGIDADEPCPNFAFGDAGTLGFHVRHQAYETAIHRWDIETAASTTHIETAADVAVDAIDELFATYTVRYSPHALAVPLVLGCTDTAAAWRVTPDRRAGFVTVERCDRTDADVAAQSADLLLLLWRRIGIDGARIAGGVDPAGVQQFLDGPITA